jgi:hypothetical protein
MADRLLDLIGLNLAWIFDTRVSVVQHRRADMFSYRRQVSRSIARLSRASAMCQAVTMQPGRNWLVSKPSAQDPLPGKMRYTS